MSYNDAAISKTAALIRDYPFSQSAGEMGTCQDAMKQAHSCIANTVSARCSVSMFMRVL